MGELEDLCADGYLKIAELIPVPEDFSGYPETCSGDAGDRPGSVQPFHEDRDTGSEKKEVSR